MTRPSKRAGPRRTPGSSGKLGPGLLALAAAASAGGLLAAALGAHASPEASFGRAQGAVAAPGAAAPTPIAAAAPAPDAPAFSGSAARQEDNVRYDGRFTFARLRFDPRLTGGSFFRQRDPPWHHDYPTAERNLMAIMEELTTLRPYRDGGNILRQGDEELFLHPIAYMSEPGFWTQTDEEAAALREYVLKGGFLIFDDFSGRDWGNFERELRRVLPEASLIPLEGTEPVFSAFFEIDLNAMVLPSYRGERPLLFGVFEDNDPSKRMVAIVNYNADIGDYWEYAESGWYPIDITNEAYKLGVNYLVYALTH